MNAQVTQLAKYRAQRAANKQSNDLDLQQFRLYQKPKVTCVEFHLQNATRDDILGTIHYDLNPTSDSLAIKVHSGYQAVTEGTETIRDALTQRVCDCTKVWPEPSIITGTDCLSIYNRLQRGNRTIFDVLEETPSKLYSLGDELLEEEDFLREYHN